MNIEHLKLFVRLASTHNISMAGQELGLSPAVASAHINKLEEGLGVRLVHRTTRKVSLTEEGQAFLPHAEEVLATVEAARGAVGVGHKAPTGTLRVTASASFGRLHLVPALKGFMAKYPELTIDFRFSDSIIDMVEGGFDVAVRLAELKDSSLVARKLAPDRRIVVASPEYLAQHGTPQSPEELVNHECVTLAGLENWVFETPEGQYSMRASGSFRTDNGDAMRDACIDGLGVSINSIWSVYKQLQKGELVEILQDYPLVMNASIWAVYPSSRLIAPKVRAFIDYFAEYYGQPPYWELELAEQQK
ncbi:MULTISPECIES: LysR family transcriptional regulator [Vibrio]|jgi:DNA-binding transcriptional LysR family regulator|uniref:LysR family transcriptional regulator n=5 Tax=Vibrio harveyi TaxID=669 RepID=A0ABN4L6Y2_VIBHA|nr:MULTISPECIES: LysR family transcriptional regulator [Vibrio]AIV08416.1 LysR family transcriptional regulator [Vibrio harveyi]AMG00353.1 LysR family transcriptional regulator [Vibrio harveyi]EKM17652.1 bacterial regulatory helix-turn-helix, lysR family protein [Vibrio harveyi]EKO3784793.1 LysR family transcriptional regulator [Vibrio harveyi]EKO3800757.1 LysR family transcriptional regulator [Vibrio harveyi]